MRLTDLRPRRDEAPLPDDVTAELEALDAALRGEGAPPGSEGLETLVSDLRAERSDPDPDFAAALDAWAAAGFERGARPGLERAAGHGGDAGARGLLARLDAQPPRRILAPAAAAVTAVVVVAVAIGSGQLGGGQDVGSGGDEPAVAPVQETGSDDAAGGGEAPAITEQLDAGVAKEAPPTVPNEAEANETGLLGGDAARSAGGDSSAFVVPSPGPGSLARGADRRRVERSAQLTLAAPADEVQGVTNEAVGVVNSYRGVVLSANSSVTDDAARATLQLAIPTRSLDAALDDLSGLADVKSLSEGSLDITRPFLDAKDELKGLRAERASLLAQIEAADSQEELDELRLRLDRLQGRIARANADFENIRRRAAQSQVTLQITSEGADEGDWSLDDALDDAGRVLTVAAGIALISAAVLLPLAIIAAIAYFVVSAGRRRARERALDS